jgi:LCP family protein required for cell wall assembly
LAPLNVLEQDEPATPGRYVPQHSARLRTEATRRWPRRVLVAANVVVAMLLLGSASVYGYVLWRFGQIRRIHIPTLLGGHGSSGQPMTVLLVGSDTRSGSTGSDAKAFGSSSQVTGQRSDTIILVHIDPGSNKATLMSIPRDLWVPIPGKGYSQRINTAFDTGPNLLVQTIKQDLGIDVNHYVEVNFNSFRQVVDAVGGIKQYFPTPARDSFSDLSIPKAGCYSLNGQTALQFVRARHYEYYANGRWHYEAESDLARIKRQQQFIRKMISKAQASGLTNPIELNNVIGGVTSNLTVDSGLSRNLMLSLAKRFRSLSPDSFPTTTLPTTPTTIQGNDVLMLKQPDAQQTINAFLGIGQPSTVSPSTAPSNVRPADVRVNVLNGSGRSGEAGQARSALQIQGFDVGTASSANNFNYTRSVVRYAPGAEAKAQLVASTVKGGALVQPDSSVQGADVVLITGRSYAGIAPVTGSSTQAGAATSTSVARPSTPPTTIYQLPGTPLGAAAPPC